ncbi:response regulator [Ferrimonas marina]|uniref:Two-component system, OmpR family, response regulator BaeR n=1 Tax=Ferrimonas marina TaxID=299255 RepID=A0A1M5NS94_9GAMM|nr:response regulator [Ferrimonas marina]SHG92446.1 two-component system, OmpR family, response regulator BaeR [Ferrimonas marina]
MSERPILIVEDEEKIANLLADYLAQAGFRSRVLLEGTEAVEVVQTERPALVILDLMLPGKDGLAICREVRQFSQVPILMLTARVDEIDRLLGLELGADDYVCKPFLPREVVARVKSILRRISVGAVAAGQAGERSYCELSLSEQNHQCRVRDEPLPLTPVEFRLLATLMEQPGRVFSREVLMQRCYPDDRIVSDRTIDSHVKNLRRKIADQIPGEERIHSIYGVGYKLE